MTQRGLAKATGYNPSRIGHIETGRQDPSREFVAHVDTILRTDGALLVAFEQHTAAGATAPRTVIAPVTGRDLRLVEFIAWLADHSDRSFVELYEAVAAEADGLDAEAPIVRHGRIHGRRNVTREATATALHDRYGPERMAHATINGHRLHMGMLTDPAWLQPTALGGDRERFRFVPYGPSTANLDEVTAAAAVTRLAAAEVHRTVMVDNPLYRLLDVDMSDGVTATMTTVPFAEYALTGDMLGDELADQLITGGPSPLRDRFLPDVTAALDIRSRVCVGGPNVLVAVARPAREAGPADYVLFVQERSVNVVNQPGALAVVPKAFHQPTGEAADEVALSTTIRRELEEELLGREDLEQLVQTAHSAVDPMHPEHNTRPLAWLLDHPDVFRLEACGFALNMVTGSFDFPCLAVVDDPAWWTEFGHLVEANWEADRVRRYSTLDTGGLAALIEDPCWSNEGLFALLCGLVRLGEVGDSGRLALPEITVGVG